MKTSQTQYAVAGAIYGTIGLLMLAAFAIGVYGVFDTQNPDLVIVAAFFGLCATGSIAATIYAFNKALAA